MATQTKPNPVTDSIETAAERLSELNEKAAGASRVEWVSTVVTAQADLTREVTKAYASAAREFVS